MTESEAVANIITKYKGIGAASMGLKRPLSGNSMADQLNRYLPDPISGQKVFWWTNGRRPRRVELIYLELKGQGWVHDMAAELLEALDGRN